MKEYVARFGGRHVLASEQAGETSGDLVALGLAATVGAVACVSVAAIESRRRSRKRLRSRRRG